MAACCKVIAVGKSVELNLKYCSINLKLVTSSLVDELVMHRPLYLFINYSVHLSIIMKVQIIMGEQK